ncbi:Long-chain-fatty-acid--CoA ligase [Nocardia cerradoensis]|uniref:Long-chain-fatty-acid--CoA ligase n=1 Tax=Nocardia cerradoensis TaxID=85688 RepID=A0A231GZR6_9NOCA|nr:acyl-CoA synthetase [Nocardia cerradoensis]OXR42104.1 Long-chain-fatty-acid--CoA ligase [Nocardia cerradoensis]
MTEQLIDHELLWPRYAEPADLPAVEAIPLEERGLPASTYALLVRAAELWPNRTALTVLPEAARWRQPWQCTYSDLLAQVHRYANLLRRLGIRRGDAVALMAPNCAELIPATLAAQLAGIAAPINPALSQHHVAELVKRSGARVLIAAGPELDATTWACARELAAQGQLDSILLLRPTAAASTPEPVSLVDGVHLGYLDESAGEEDARSFAGQPPQSHDVAGLFHTGGTTGVPKPAAHTHRGEVANAWMIAANSLLDEQAVGFAALPLFHVNALVVTLLAPLFKGQAVVWAGPLGYRDVALYAEFWKIVAHYRIAAMSAVPTVYAVLAQCPVDADISTLRYAMVGASPLPAAVRDNFQAHTGVTLVEGYGLTEATCASARSFPNQPRPGAVGQRMPYQRIKVVRVGDDGTWHGLPAGETGVLAISGPTVFAGYVSGHDEHGHVLDGLGKLVDGWLDTGDLAHIDEDGFIHLHGREKDLIIRGGHNIDPALVEDALLSHPSVTAAGAVGRPDVHSGEVPVVYVTLTAGDKTTESELLAWAGEHVPERAAAPKAVVVLDALPVTDVGKPYKLGLRADATRREVRDALSEVLGVTSVAAVIEDGSIITTVELESDADRARAEAVVSAYAIEWKVVVR